MVKLIIGIAAAVVSTVGIGVAHKILNGYDENGFNRKGYDKDGFNRNGYDKDGYNKKGFDYEDRDRNGYGKDGYNKKGFNKDGFNYEGRDKNGFDIDGYDENGFDIDGFDIDGYDENGFDIDGFDIDGYDENGRDRNGFSDDDVFKIADSIKQNYKEAKEYFNQNDFFAFMGRCRITIEKIYGFYVKYNGYNSRKFSENISLCNQIHLISDSEAEELNKVREYCNCNAHEGKSNSEDASFANEILNIEINKFIEYIQPRIPNFIFK